MKRTNLLILFLMIMASINMVNAQSAVPDLINYQGYVTDAAGIPLGSGSPANLDVDFKFFTVATAGVPIYGERQTVTINEGDFSVLIGGGDPIPNVDNVVSFDGIFSNKDVFLEITVDKDNNGLTDDSPITPRQQIVTTAFAFRAKVAESVDNLAITEDMLAGSSITTAKLSDGSVTTDKIVVNSIVSTSIADGSIDTVDLKDNSVTANKIQANAVNSSKVQDNSLTGSDIQNYSLTSVDVANYSLTNQNYQAGSVTRYTLGDGAVQTEYGNELVMLRGTFSPTAATIAATGCFAGRFGVGVYYVQFNRTFSSIPTVVVSSNGNGETYYDNLVSAYGATTSYVYIVVTDGGSNGGARQDGGFDVIVVGPGS